MSHLCVEFTAKGTTSRENENDGDDMIIVVVMMKRLYLRSAQNPFNAKKIS